MDRRKIAPLSSSPESETDMEMASDLVQRFERFADGDEDGAPWWFGWSIHRAFLIGLRLGRLGPSGEVGRPDAFPPAEAEEPDEAREGTPPPPISWRDWSGEDDDWLSRNWAGQSDQDLAKALGRTKGSVRVRRQNLGLVMRRNR